MIESDTEIYREALGKVTVDQPKRGRNNNMSQGIKINIMILIETAELS